MSQTFRDTTLAGEAQMTHIEEWGVHERFLQAGAAEVLPKDVPFREVLAAVRRLGH